MAGGPTGTVAVGSAAHGAPTDFLHSLGLIPLRDFLLR